MSAPYHARHSLAPNLDRKMNEDLAKNEKRVLFLAIERIRHMNDLFLIVDGNSLMHRAFHALPLMDYQGVPTNALHGFLMMLLRVISEKQPRYVAVAFDEHAPTFRHTLYADYKAGRQKTPAELIDQLHRIRDVLRAMHIKVYACAGYEADDILGTVAGECTRQNIDTLLLTGDRDALQLVDEHVSLLFTRKGISETTLFDPATVKDYFGFTPSQVTDYKGLVGDSSDNIPGVPGVGDKTGVKLLAEYGTMENVLQNASSIKGKLGEKLRDNMDKARFSKQLATILPQAPINFQLEDCALSQTAQGLDCLIGLGLNSVVKQAQKVWAGTPEPERVLKKDAPPRPEAVSLLTQADIAAFIDKTRGQETALHVCGAQITFATMDCLCVVALSETLFNEGFSDAEAWKALAPLFARPLVVHDGKTLMHLMHEYMDVSPTFSFDAMLAQYLINPQEKSYALNRFVDLEDAFSLLCLSHEQREQLNALGMAQLYQDIELPLLCVLYHMEVEGFLVDTQVLKALGEGYAQKTEALKNDIYRLTGVNGFNISSPQQLGKVLFETLGLQTGKKTQRGFSTDADTLEKIKDSHPAITPILEYRQYMKFKGTYVDGLLSKTDSAGRIKSSFNQTATATGRISSSEPNLQNIPVRTDLGREIRRAFIAKAGYALIDADYSQIELRLLAHMSGDSAMVDAFNKGQDIHTRTAAEVYGVAMDEVTSQMRSAAKAVNFGLVYGISEFGLAENIGVSRKEAGAFIKQYFERYPAVHEFMQSAKAFGYEHGYAVTLYGRRRALPELKSPNAVLRGFGERVAMNMPVQGTAADIIKLAMVRVDAQLRELFPHARLILQVHDELLIEAPEMQAPQVSTFLQDAMEQVAHLSVPLKSEVKYGKSWYDTK